MNDNNRNRTGSGQHPQLNDRRPDHRHSRSVTELFDEFDSSLIPSSDSTPPESPAHVRPNRPFYPVAPSFAEWAKHFSLGASRAKKHGGFRSFMFPFFNLLSLPGRGNLFSMTHVKLSKLRDKIDQIADPHNLLLKQDKRSTDVNYHVSILALQRELRRSTARFEKQRSQAEVDTATIDHMEFLFLSKVFFSQAELLYNVLLVNLNEITDYIAFWTKRYQNPSKYVFENGPIYLLQLLPMGISKYKEDVKEKLRFLKALQKRKAAHVGRLKRILDRVSKAKSPLHLRTLMIEYTIMNIKFLQSVYAEDPEDLPYYIETDADEDLLLGGGGGGDTAATAATTSETGSTATDASAIYSAAGNKELYDFLNQCCEFIESYEIETQTHVSKASPPSHLKRKWLPYAILCCGIAYGANFLYQHSSYNNSNDLNIWFKTAKEGISSFVYNHITEPIVGITTQIFENHYRSIFDPRELQDAKDSLARMLLDLGVELNPNMSPDQFEKLKLQAASWDTSVFSTELEEEIKHPVKNALFGQLVRMMMIQVQRLKMDLLLAMEELDVILRANQMNIYIMATIPSVMMIAAVVAYLNRFSKKARSTKQIYAKIIVNLREVERIINKCTPETISGAGGGGGTLTAQYEMDCEELGFLLLSLSKIESCVQLLSKGVREENENLFRMMREDIHELESDNFSNQQKLRTIDRMWRTYNFSALVRLPGLK